jgi:Protein of unknown function (DUF4236)
MGWRYQKRITLIPGVRVNISKNSTSLSLGVRGAHYTISPKGSRTTVGLPGSGLFYTDYKPWKRGEALPPPPPVPYTPSSHINVLGVVFWTVILLTGIAYLAR